MHKGGGVHFNLGSFSLSGNTTISGNTCAGQTSNIYRRNKTNTLTVSNLSSTASFGIYTEAKESNTSNNVVSITGLTADNVKCFFNDITGTTCSYVDGNLDLRPTSATPTITTQPSSQTVGIGTNVIFSVAATASDGGTLSYQWEKQTGGTGDWANVSGATSASYTISSTTIAMNGDKYRCKISNLKESGYFSCTLYSDAVTLTVSEHTHNWQYVSDEAKLTAKCNGNYDCTVTNGKTDGVSITLTAVSPTYSGIGVTTGWKTGQTVNFTLEGKDNWKSVFGDSSLPEINYEGTGTTSYTKSATKPTQAGTYKASITKNDETASINFVIKQVYQITFDSNGGIGTMSSVEVSPGSYILPLCSIRAPRNMEFDGWALTSSGDKISTITTQVSGNITLYAKWKNHTHRLTATELSDGTIKYTCGCGFYIIKFE